MKFISILLFFLLSLNVFAARVVLLSSVETPKIWYHSKDWKIEDSLEKIFHKSFKKSGYEIIIKEKVDQQTLWEELHNPDNIALFWVSHAKAESQLANGITNDAAVVDYFGNDVKDLFRSVHPNMRYLGLIGCNAKSLLQTFKENGDYNSNPNLITHSFDKKIDARKGLRQSIKNSAKSLGIYKKNRKKDGFIYSTPSILSLFSENRMCEQETSVYEVKITRTSDVDVESVAVKVNSKVLAILPAMSANDIQDVKVFIPSSIVSTKHDLKITIDSNKYYSATRLDLGQFDFQAVNFIGNWKLFAKKDGTPIGITKNLYQYKGKVPEIESTTLKSLYQCSTN
ncbi:hypothetical protein [Bacteriovorax sp. Seq25_V]|uniref:hypothetical protein n=1 Tax=Bacteriovorax sp. Seq25_V TaxID=1201288 RepID=UPI000389FB60|nr:hypothetical protein [Bacteriovorax sp. Seq25_V]EQC46905.1 hypothetical protein M900_2542 [Bacteriovorax sp. Seq25_V]